MPEDVFESFRRRNGALPQLYYDTCSYLAGAIEILPEVHNHPNYGTDSMGRESSLPQREEAMKTLLSHWNPELAFLSYFTMSESIDVATRKYELPLSQVLSIIVEGIDRDYSLLPAEFELARPESDVVSRLEKKIPARWEFAKIRSRVMARDASGKELGLVSRGFTTTSGATPVVFKAGSPETFRDVQSYDHPQSLRIEDSKFERELLLGAAQLASNHSIHLTDAVHVLMCMGKGMLLVTSDQRMLKRFTKMTAGLPHAVSPEWVLQQYGRQLTLQQPS